MRILLFLLASTALFSACKNQNDNNSAPDATEIPTPRLICEERPSGVEYIDKMYAVYFIFEESKIKLGEIPACDLVVEENWSHTGIPAEALQAAGGWYAGAGDYYYILAENEGYKVYQVSVDEISEKATQPVEIYATKKAR